MPSPRWWEFEDGEGNLNDINEGGGELGTRLVTEYARLYGNDWFQIDLDVPIGSLARITELTVTDTFGEVTARRRVIQRLSRLESGTGFDCLYGLLGDGIRRRPDRRR